MSRITLGILCGLVFGALSVVALLPMKLPNKHAAQMGAFVNGVTIGVVIGAANLGWPLWVSGLFWGMLLSLPNAMITKAWVPLLSIGVLGGLVIGILIGQV